MRAEHRDKTANPLLTFIFYLFCAIHCFSAAASAAFLSLGGGPRNAALGNSIVASGEDLFFAQVNPALLSQMKNPQFCFEYQKLFTGLPGPTPDVPGFRSADIRVSNVAFGVPFRRLIGTFGISYTGLQSPNLYQEETIQLHVARALNDVVLRDEEESLGVGVNLKFLKRSVEPDDFNRATLNAAGNSASAVTMDLGSFYKPVPDISVGMSLGNLLAADVGVVKEDQVPREIIGGFSWSEPIKDFARQSLISAAISRREGEMRTNFHMGVEVAFGVFTPRLGFNRDQFSSGFGLEFTQNPRFGIALDYAFIFPVTLSDTAGSHRFALKVDWKKEKGILEGH